MTKEEELLKLSKLSSEALLNYGNIAVQAATGVGKSKIALDAIDYVSKKEHIQRPRLLFVVAERGHIKNWINEMNKWKFTKTCSILCYASLKKVANTNWDFVIFDEAHHLNTDLKREIFESIVTPHTIFLSATLKDNFVEYLKEHVVGHNLKSIKCSLDEAFKANILREPRIILCPLYLNNTVNNAEIVIKWGAGDREIRCLYKDRWRYIINKNLFPDTKLIISCTAKQKYDYICEQYNYYKDRFMRNSHNDMLKNKWLQWGSKRKIYLGYLKTKIVQGFLPKIEDKRYICFCTNIEQAETLNKKNCIHHKKKNSLDIIDAFNDKKISNLFAVGMAKEGMNLTDIEVGVIIQLDGEERTFIQKFGRSLRADNPIQYIFYFKETRDEEYLNNALEGIDKKYIKETGYEDIFGL